MVWKTLSDLTNIIMLKHNFLKTSWCKLRTRYTHKNASLSEASKSKECAIAKIRNIGILAHIDAG